MEEEVAFWLNLSIVTLKWKRTWTQSGAFSLETEFSEEDQIIKTH